MKIKVLPDTIVNQIAAGEVVERPASVVRELVDNAVDSGASDIFVALEAGGHSRIRVRDNGCGMSRDDAVLAFERHATSKVKAIEDLWHLHTLGFRGEALASIAAVAKVKLTTKEKDAAAGTEVIFRGGALINVQTQAWGEGTEIEIEHLFFNTPARRKFLKSPRAELSRVRSWIAHSSLSRPGIRYRLVSDGDEVLNLPRVESIEERAKGVFSDGLMPVRLSEGGISVAGMVAHPGQAIADSSGLVILINGRLVTDKIIVRAVREGFDSMLKDREFPVGYLLIQMPPEYLDVNVHPQKSEVRFRHAEQIFAVVRGAVLAGVREMKVPMRWTVQENPRSDSGSVRSSGLASATPTYTPYSESNLATASQSSSAVFAPEPLPQSRFHLVPHLSVQPSLLGSTTPLNQYDLLSSMVEQPPTGKVEEAAFRFSDLRYVGQVLQCYLLCELSEKLVVVDMHAAHERVNYNKIRTARALSKLTTQQLLIPEVIRLPEEHVVCLLEQEPFLAQLGFIVTQGDFDSVVVSGVPGVVSHLNTNQLIREFAAEPLASTWKERFEERIDHMAARIACHASVRSGDLLSREEAYALFRQLDDTQLSAACPHGRPIVAEFLRSAVELWFGRDK
jgi:DNA mismatch repair protein MutL